MFIPSKNKDANEINQREFERIQKKAFNISDKNGNYTYDTYKSMISVLPNKISMLDQEIDIQQMNAELDFFQLLIKFPKIPKEITEKEFILALLYKTQQFQNDELMLKFTLYIIRLYDFDEYVPPDELIQFAFQIILNAAFPLQNLQEKIISNFFVFIFDIYDYIDQSIINNQEFISYLTNFFNISTQFNFTITYYFTLLANNCKSAETFSFFPTLISLIYGSVIPLEMQSIKENRDEDSKSVVLNITSIISSFASNSAKGANYFIPNAGSIIPPLAELWGISDDINANLIDIVSDVSKKAILMFPKPELANQQQIFFDIIKHCLDNGGGQIILNSLIASTNYTTESLFLLKRLIHINLTKGTSFLFEGPNGLYPIFRRILYFCAEGKISERCAAGCCLSKIIRLCPNFLLGYFANSGDQIMSYLQLTPDEISEFTENPDLVFIGLISNLFYLDDLKLDLQLIKALFVISKRFNDMDKMHEFREACALYNVEEKINTITEKYEKGKKGEKVYDLGNNFILAAFGVVDFNQVDVPS